MPCRSLKTTVALRDHGSSDWGGNMVDVDMGSIGVTEALAEPVSSEGGQLGQRRVDGGNILAGPTTVV